jgi:hypothetical protein
MVVDTALPAIARRQTQRRRQFDPFRLVLHDPPPLCRQLIGACGRICSLSVIG